MNVVIPVRTVNPLNRREHHFERAKRVRYEHLATLAELRGRPPKLPVIVTLTRISPRSMDSDGAVAALKGVRDAIAKWMGVDDRDSPDLIWRYGKQERGPMGVRVEIQPAEGAK